MRRDEKNIIIKDIFTESEIKELYEVIDNVDLEKNTHVQKVFCHRAYFVPLPDSVLDKIKKIAAQNYHLPLKLTEVSFARYSYDMYRDGIAPVTPSLYPHCDNAFHEPRLTIDFQVRSNRDWPIVVEEREYTLKDNQALTFSGTHQVHWRPHTEWKEDDFVDLIFTHFSLQDCEPNSLDNDQEHITLMKTLTEKYVEQWNKDAPEGQTAILKMPNNMVKNKPEDWPGRKDQKENN